MADKAPHMLSLSELCSKLSVSEGAGRNWLRLGKLIPTAWIQHKPFFSYEYAEKLSNSIALSDNSALKFRRNKKYISGNNIYNSYISEKSLNLQTVHKILNDITVSNITITDELMTALIADCAVQLIISGTEGSTDKSGLAEYINNSFIDNPYMYLADDLIGDKMKLLAVIERYPQFFGHKYSYQQNEDTLGLLYISLKDMGSRKSSGLYYTPSEITAKMCDRLFSINPKYTKTILDPCCGTGNFILSLPEDIDRQNIYGMDIDEISVKIARINYALKYSESNRNIIFSHIFVKNYLEFSDNFKFDYIIGNPPWGYTYSDSQKTSLASNFRTAKGTAVESCDLFIEKALRNLKEDGVLSFAVPQALLNVKSHMKIREIILECGYFQYVEYLGNVFDKVQCPGIILQILRTDRRFSAKGMTVRDKKREFIISDNRKVNAERFSFNITDDEYRIIERIENAGNRVTLSGNAVFAMGIVTGDNKKHISSQKHPGNELIFRGADIFRFRAAKPHSYITFSPDLFQQTAPLEYYRAHEKLLYRFICSQPVFAYDSTQTLSLNSCNILIPHIPGLDIKYVLAVLNSRTVQFYFKKKFDSVKVLRSHLEQIPIPQINRETQKDITAIVDRLLKPSENCLDYFNTIDNIIAELYNLNKSEYALICESMSKENLFLI